MKINYNLKHNYYKMYGEANYLFAYKKQFLYGTKTKIKNILTYFVGFIASAFLLLYFSRFINSNIIRLVSSILCSISCIVFAISFFAYSENRKHNSVGTITINKSGITDVGAITTKVSWDKIELIGITKNTLVLLIKDSPILILLEPDEKVIKEIEKYTPAKIIRN